MTGDSRVLTVFDRARFAVAFHNSVGLRPSKLRISRTVPPWQLWFAPADLACVAARLDSFPTLPNIRINSEPDNLCPVRRER